MIKLVVSDFDGVFTDGKCFFDGNGNINKYYNVKDGMALKLLREHNIEFGIISSYKTEKSLMLNGTDINKELIEHLNIKRVFIGKCGSKMDILSEWLKEMNISIEDVAYIGDDLNDLDVINNCALSACPNDAIEACKNAANYICNKKGGEGCVREFIDYILSDTKKSNLLQEIKREANYQLDNFNDSKITELTDIISNCKGNIFFMGVGKSGNIANHCCQLLKSISVNTFFLDTVDALHGDIGIMNDKDIVIMFSKSGNTKELIEIILYIKERNAYLIGVCCDDNSQFHNLCDKTLQIPFKNEINGVINKIPTNSCMSQLLFSNILVSKLKINVSLDIYSSNHPAGSIGKNLKRIRDVIYKDYPCIILENNKVVSFIDILLEMNKKKIGCCFFIDKQIKLIGILTDGDIRRLLLKTPDLKEISINELNTNFYCETDTNKFIKDLKHYNYIPCLENKTNKLLGIIIN